MRWTRSLLNVVVLLPLAAPLHAEVLWTFKGELASSDGFSVSTSTFDETDGDGSITNIQQADAVVAQFFPRAAADAAGHTLKSGAKVNLQLLGTDHGFWNGAKVAAVSRAGYSDTLTVLGEPGLDAGFLRFQWAVHGDLIMQRNGGGALELGHALGYELFIHGAGVRQTVRQDHLALVLGAPDPQPGEFVEPIGLGLVNSLPFSQSANFNFSGSEASIVVPFQAGTPVDLDFFLLTWVSITTEAVDLSSGLIDGDASFHNTSTLLALNVLDENLQPLDTPYTIESAAGLTYPVPEPTTLGPLTLALTALARRRTR